MEQSKGRIAMIAYTQLRYDSRVVREALAAVEAGYQVDFFTLKEQKPAQVPGLKVIYTKTEQYRGSNKFLFVGSYVSFLLFCMRKITARHFKQRYDVVHVNNMPNFLVFSTLLVRMMGVKVILDIHDLMPELFAEKFALPLNHWIIKLLYLEERWSANYAHLVISTNRLQSRRFKENKIRKSEFPIILNASDEKVFVPFTDHDYDSKPLVLVFPSTIAKRLGLDVLVDAMEIVAQTHKDVVLKVFGDGEYRPALVERIEEKSLTDQVRFEGLIDHKALSDQLEQAHVGVIPWPSGHSTNYQMPVKINEYFTKGLAAIVSDVEILKEYFSDKALFFEAGNAQDFAQKIIELHENRALLKQLAAAGHEFYQANSWSRYKQDYQQILDKLCS